MTGVALAEVADVNPRVSSKPSGDDPVAFVPMAELNAVSATTSTGETRSFSDVSKGYTLFEDGDLLVAKITPCFENNKIGQARLAHPVGVGSSEFHVVRPNRELVDDRYLLHFLRQDYVRIDGERRMTGSGGQRRVPPAFLKELKVPLPALAHQRRIAAILDQADALRAKRRRVITHIDALPHSIFNDLFGSEIWNSTIGELANVQTGPFGSLLHKEDYVSDGVPVINPMHIRNGQLQPDVEFSVTDTKAASLPLYRLQEGDVVLGRRGEMGRAGVVGAQHVGMLCGTGSLILRPRDVDSRFLHSVVTSPRMKAHLERSSLGATLPNLNATIVKTSPAPKAPDHAQAQFAEALRAVDGSRDTTRRAALNYDELFTSLESRAFRGEL